MKKRFLIFVSFLFISVQFYSQNPNVKPKFELFSKHSIGFNSPSSSGNLILGNEISLYINSFGNTIGCNSNTSLGGCIFLNIVSIFSAYEISAGFDTHLGENSSPVFRPKIGVYLRPLYYGKIGINFTTKNPIFSAGFTIPIKNFQLELLYNDVRSYKDNSFSSTSSSSSKYQIGIMIPLN